MKTLADTVEVINTLVNMVEAQGARITALEELLADKKRGPKSDRPMTDEDAWLIKFGDLKDLNHKQAAEALGLSYGQVFSCRGSYTFKHVRKNWKEEMEKKEGTK